MWLGLFRRHRRDHQTSRGLRRRGLPHMPGKVYRLHHRQSAVMARTSQTGNWRRTRRSRVHCWSRASP
eukprot:3391199-Pyramimonas_sp.AAC.1